MSIIKRLQNLAGITLTEGKEFSSEKNYADKSESELQACKKELKAIQAITSKASFKWKDAQTEIDKVDAALAELKDKSKKEEVKESLNEAAWDVFLNGKKIDTVFDSETDAAEVKRSLVDHDGYDSGITVRKARKAKKLKEAKFDTIELRLPAHWASALVNGDTSGLEDEEEATMNQWIEWASEEYNINAGQPVDVSDEPEFASHHDASPDVLATDVLTYTYFVNESVEVNEAKEEALWVLKIAEPGSDKFGVQFSGTRKECADEWKDTKESWGKGAKHKIERHIEESVLSITEDDSSSSEYEWEVQGNYEGEWEAVTTETNRKDAVSSLKDYRENEKGTSFRIRRVKVTEATEGNMLTPRQKAKLMSLAKEYLEAKNAGFSENARQIFRGMSDLYDSDDIFRAIDQLAKSGVKESAEAIAARIIQEVDGTKTPEVDYQNGPTENSGIKAEQKKTIRVPSDVRAEVNKRIRELNKAISDYDEKGYNDKSIKAQAVECLEKIMDDLKSGDVEGVKHAQIYFGTLMSPLTDFFPPKLINWLANANNKLMKEEADSATGTVAERIMWNQDKKLYDEHLKFRIEKDGHIFIVFDDNSGYTTLDSGSKEVRLMTPEEVRQYGEENSNRKAADHKAGMEAVEVYNTYKADIDELGKSFEEYKKSLTNHRVLDGYSAAQKMVIILGYVAAMYPFDEYEGTVNPESDIEPKRDGDKKLLDYGAEWAKEDYEESARYSGQMQSGNRSQEEIDDPMNDRDIDFDPRRDDDFRPQY